MTSLPSSEATKIKEDVLRRTQQRPTSSFKELTNPLTNVPVYRYFQDNAVSTTLAQTLQITAQPTVLHSIHFEFETSDNATSPVAINIWDNTSTNANLVWQVRLRNGISNVTLEGSALLDVFLQNGLRIETAGASTVANISYRYTVTFT